MIDIAFTGDVQVGLDCTRENLSERLRPGNEVEPSVPKASSSRLSNTTITLTETSKENESKNASQKQMDKRTSRLDLENRRRLKDDIGGREYARLIYHVHSYVQW